MTAVPHRSATPVALMVAAVIAAGAAVAALASSIPAAPAGWKVRSAVPASPALAGTRIEVDDRTHVIRFFIDGEQLAMLDAVGLHVEDGAPAQ